MPKPSLYDLSLADLESLVRGWGQPSFRARQIYRQLYIQLAAEPMAMTDLSLVLREHLAAETTIGGLTLVRTQVAADGQTRKALFALSDGVLIETVLMLYAERTTVCISTQAGCGMGCTFCATAQLGLRRNLRAGEMVAQALWASREVRALEAGNRISNVVFMGMGEPLANYDQWWAAVQRLHDPQGFNLGARSMTVSTVGLVPEIRRLATEGLPINLAISLHAPDDALRSTLVPINRRYPIAELLAATREYITQTGRRVSFEYVLLQNRNDHPHHALALAKLLRGQTAEGANRGLPLLCHVNLIPWNPLPGSALDRSDMQRVQAFQQVLLDYGVACTVRIERGVEIAAACGQLAGV